MMKNALLVAGVAAGCCLGMPSDSKADDCFRGGYSSFRPTVPNYGHNPYGSYYGAYPGYGGGHGTGFVPGYSVPGYGVPGYGVPGYGAGYGSYRPPVGIPGGFPCESPRYSSRYGSGGYVESYNGNLGNSSRGNTWGSYGSGGFPASGSFGNSLGNLGGLVPGVSLYIGR
jgi:hypothetical protein